MTEDTSADTADSSRWSQPLMKLGIPIMGVLLVVWAGLLGWYTLDTAEKVVKGYARDAILLEQMGHECVLVNDGEKALEALHGESFDLILMDVMMPQMDGVTAVKHLRELEAQDRPHTAVIMVTAHAMTGDRERFIAAGADGYVSKPMSEAALRKEINRACLRNT
jgi:CheY-like chemotaxis protein